MQHLRSSGRRRHTESLPSAQGWHDMDVVATRNDLVPPQNAEVRMQLAAEGRITSCLAVALSMVQRMMQLPGADPTEIAFLSACLKAPRGRTAAPLRRHAIIYPFMDDIEPFLWERACTEPTPGTASTGALADLEPPDTAAVRQQLEAEGPFISLMDIGVQILKRLRELPGSDPGEALFVQACLMAPCSKVAAAPRFGTLIDDQPSMGDQPCDELTSESPSRRLKWTTLSPSLVTRPAGADDEVARWPCAVEESAEEQLQGILASNFEMWGFDMFALSGLTSGRPLQFVGWEVFRRGDFFSEFAVEPQAARCYFANVEAAYGNRNTIPYHNNMHGADVTQAVYALLQDIGFGQYLPALGKLSLLISALVHDVGHDGRSNNFHVRVMDVLAITYNDMSVLENYHASLAFRLMFQSQEANILAGLTHDQLAQVREDIISNVLSTDMAKHIKLMHSARSLISELGPDPHAWLTRGQQELQVVLLHLADIATPAKPATLSDKWGRLLMEEFFLQGDEEERLNLPVTPICERHAVSFQHFQINFLDIFVKPSFSLMANLEPKIDKVVRLIDSNRSRWEKEEKDLSLSQV
ncbi:unnamed protein product [Polarella glacialis]|uniref:Phosphodiesterase n=1 Tax=Polarella glacialis TaxID=89957 RepID=A0A813FQC1_POLGL|nr:unnamed protein product [Polarella glacialis]